MSTLSKRATPPQQRILRAVEGGIKNACHAHPELSYDPRLTKSISKRVTGTLTSQWREMLAATGPSKKALLARSTGDGPMAADLRKWLSKRKGSQISASPSGREAEHSAHRFPVRLLIRELSRQIKPLQLAGEVHKAEGIIEALRVIDRLRFR